MASKTLHMNLGPDGWVSDSVRVADNMFSDYFLSDFSQTANFPNDVSSLSYVLETNRGDVTAICQAVQRQLHAYFEKQFSDVSVEVYSEDVADSINLKAINVIMTFTDTVGVEYNLSRIINFSGMTVTDILKVING